VTSRLEPVTNQSIPIFCKVTVQESNISLIANDGGIGNVEKAESNQAPLRHICPAHQVEAVDLTTPLNDGTMGGRYEGQS
jgi:hypothetical protein